MKVRIKYINAVSNKSEFSGANLRTSTRRGFSQLYDYNNYKSDSVTASIRAGHRDYL